MEVITYQCWNINASLANIRKQNMPLAINGVEVVTSITMAISINLHNRERF